MNSKDENNDKKIEIKHKTRKTKPFSFFVVCDLKKKKTIKGKMF